MDSGDVSKSFGLPAELLVMILETLPCCRLIHFREVSRFFRELVDTHVVLQYKIALFTAALQDGPASLVSTSDRLKVLNAHQLAWESLAWSDRTTVSKEPNGVWELYGNIFAQGIDHERRKLSFLQLPSALRGIPRSHWEVEVDFTIRDFGMDPSNDLLVLIEVALVPGNSKPLSRIHFRSLSSGDRHPLARVNPIDATEIKRITGRWGYTIQISGNHLGLLYDAREPYVSINNELFIWNWVTGYKCLSLESDALYTFTFISDRHIVVGMLQDSYNVDDDNDDIYDPPSLDIIEFPEGSLDTDSNNQHIHLYTLHYPTFAAGVTPGEIRIQGDPAPGWTPPVAQAALFHVAHGERVFVIRIQLVTETRALEIVQFVPLATLTAFIPAAGSTSMPPPSPVAVPWEAWGPTGSRMTAKEGTDETWVCHVFGTQFVSSLRVRRVFQQTVTAATRLKLWDFNQRAFRRGVAGKRTRGGEGGDDAHDERGAQVRDEGDQKGYHYVDEPLQFELQGIFAEPVVTSLPYRYRTKVVPAGTHDRRAHVAVMLSEDNIMLVDRSNLGDVRHNQFLTF